MVSFWAAGSISDSRCKPRSYQIACAEELIEELTPDFQHIIADKGMDSDELRIEIMENGSIPIIPTKSNLKRKTPGFKKRKYKSRHKAENFFADIKHLLWNCNEV